MRQKLTKEQRLQRQVKNLKAYIATSDERYMAVKRLSNQQTEEINNLRWQLQRTQNAVDSLKDILGGQFVKDAVERMKDAEEARDGLFHLTAAMDQRMRQCMAQFELIEAHAKRVFIGLPSPMKIGELKQTVKVIARH